MKRNHPEQNDEQTRVKSQKSMHRRIVLWILLIYLALLICSHLFRLINPAGNQPRSWQQSLILPAADDDGDDSRTAVPGAGHVHADESGPLTIAYRDSDPGATSEKPVLILLHGSPVSSIVFRPLAPLLSDTFRLVIPDLPGFGGSTLRVPDYSIRSHADAVLRFLDSLEIGTAHLLAYSQSGGVALHMADRAPERVRSLIMVSAIGVQEMELLGGYRVNHGLHGAQLGLIWLLLELTPHFGTLDDSVLAMPYARNFYDSDQRPLRGFLQGFEGPMLIVHGRGDCFVPTAAAVEHHRIVPQSELVLIEGGHGLVFADPETVAEPLSSFILEVEAGRSTVRSSADPARVRASAASFDVSRTGRFEGMGLIVIGLLLAVSTFVSEDLTCIAAGLLVGRGTLPYWPAMFACFLGIFIGDVGLYFAGRWLGRPAVKRWPLRWLLRPGQLKQAERWFARRGMAAILISRFIPGTRLPTYVSAGLVKARFIPFALTFIGAGLLWVAPLVWLTALLGERIWPVISAFRYRALPALLILMLAIFLVVKIVVPAFTYRGRRLLVSRWYRLTRWEFWPPWVFYPPLFLYLIWLGIRHRGLTLFTAANPALPAGGFIGESKAAILDGLKGEDHVARYLLIEPDPSADRRMEALFSFMRDQGLEYPVVLKPDAGQRGQGVEMVGDGPAARRYLERVRGAVLVQEYAAGREFGVFYVRMPGDERGRIFSVTDKRLLSVTGDGRSTLERLILSNPRAVCMAQLHLSRHADRLEEIPAEGERIQLVDVGTHCLGAVFLDGAPLITPELEAAVDGISRCFEGFHFGRFDIRAPSEEEFRQGRGLKVIELNGVTSEATAIYDPSHRLVKAYAILMKQWRLAYEIGARNRERGYRPVSVRALLRLVRDFKPAPEEDE